MALIRDIDPATLAAMSRAFHPVVLLHVDWPGGAVRVHSGLGTLVWGGHEWTGVGVAGSLTLPDESAGLAALPGEMRLGGDPAAIDAVHDVDPSGVAVDVWFGAVTERAGATLVGAPFSIFTGYVDGMGDETVADGAGVARAVIAGLASGPSQRAGGAAHHSYEDQIAAFPGDTAGRWLKGDVSRTVVEVPKW